MKSVDKLKKLLQLKILIQGKEALLLEKQKVRQQTIEEIRSLGQEIGQLRTTLMESI